VDRVLAGPSGSPSDDVLLARLARAGAAVERPVAGQLGVLGDLRWRILWPPARGGAEPGNEASVALEFQPVGECRSGCLSSLFLGDLGEEAQDRLLAASRPARVDIVKVSHHGSSDQSAALYDRVAATIGLIGISADNGYGHPTESVLEVLAGAGTSVLRTDTQGMLLVAPGARPGEFAVWSERPP
jgi:competence protein ComEC